MRRLLVLLATVVALVVAAAPAPDSSEVPDTSASSAAEAPVVRVDAVTAVSPDRIRMAERAVRTAATQRTRARQELARAVRARRACATSTCRTRATAKVDRARTRLARARRDAVRASTSHRALLRQARAERAAAATRAEQRRVAALRGDASAWRPLFPGQDLYWDGCRVIGYRVNLDGAPSWAVDQVRLALDEVTRRSGHTFAYRGTTSLVPDAGVDYPSDTDLVLAWVRPGQSSLLGRDQAATAVAVGGILSTESVGLRPDGTQRRRADDGLVLLNREFSYPRGLNGAAPSYPTTIGHVLLHEMGHVLGLDHVGNEQQLMNAVLEDGRPGLGAGDLAGMRAMGSEQLCVRRS